MPSYALIDTIVVLTDLMIPITLLTVLFALKRSQANNSIPWQIVVPIVLALAWGGMWVWVPALAALRLQPPPAGQAAAILGLIVGLCSLLLIRSVRDFFRTASVLSLVTLGPWRIVYGLALLGIGLLGGLPSAFFWSAALGDIGVGLWSLLILSRSKTVTEREVMAWNVVGLLDLSHVLVLGALNLRGFYLADTSISPLNLLPIVGVPVFLALHVMTLWALLQRRNAVKSTLPS
jgi:hypothetical protein